MHRVWSVLCYTVAKAECSWWKIKLLLNVAHWQAWYCSEGTMWASYAIQDRENVTCTAPEFLLNWCFDHCCSSRAALYPQVTRQTCAWTITGTPCVTATSLAVELGRRHTSVIFSAVAWAQHVGIYTAFMPTQPCSGALQGHSLSHSGSICDWLLQRTGL